LKLVDRLLKQVKEILTAKNFDYDTNEDGFLNALGVNPEQYRIDYPNGEHGYDVLKALYEVSEGLWDED
jgi:hypothetical protein